MELNAIQSNYVCFICSIQSNEVLLRLRLFIVPRRKTYHIRKISYARTVDQI